jgi:hypothetical protein
VSPGRAEGTYIFSQLPGIKGCLGARLGRILLCKLTVEHSRVVKVVRGYGEV